METKDLYNLGLPLYNLPFFLVFIFFIPVMDTIRVMSVRLLRGKGPFNPDRTHLHHYFLDSWGWSHLKTSAFIGLISLFMGGLGYFLCNYMGYLTLFSGFILFYIATLYLSQKFRKIKIKAVKNGTVKQTFFTPKINVKAS
jgi:hypothetical protein